MLTQTLFVQNKAKYLVNTIFRHFDFAQHLRVAQLIRTGNRHSNKAAYRRTKVPLQSLHRFLHLTDDCSLT